MLEGHPKCVRLHGHNYKVVVIVQSSVLDNGAGWVCDFAEMDEVIKPAIELLDHRYIVSNANLSAGCPYVNIALNNGDDILLPIIQSTAELIGEWLFDELQKRFEEPISLSKVEIWETAKSCAVITK